jgi:hypothetical protein
LRPGRSTQHTMSRAQGLKTRDGRNPSQSPNPKSLSNDRASLTRGEMRSSSGRQVELKAHNTVKS